MLLRSKFVLLPALACLLSGQAFASQLPVASLRVSTDVDTVEELTNLPVTVTALDADGDVKTDYIGTVYFVVKGDPDPKIPANKSQGYTFQSSENGTHLFSQGITFSQPGVTEVDAIDLDNENVQGVKLITVVPNPCKAPSVLISILTPKDGTVVSVPNVSINGVTKPMCAAQILLNGNKVGDVKASDKGAYASDIAGLKEGENVVTALLNNGNKSSIRVIYEREKVAITGPAEGAQVPSACNVVTGTSNPGKTVTVAINGKTAGTATADAAGNWTLNACGFVPGADVVTATAKAGTKASVNVTLTYSIVITSPLSGARLTSAPGMNSAPSGSGILATVTGRAGPEAPVSIRIGKQDICWGVTDGSGSFSIPNCPLPSCDVAILADQRDDKGTTLATSAPAKLKVLPEGNICDQVRFTCLKGSRADGRATLDFCVAPDGPAVASFRILTGASCEALSGSVNTPDKKRAYGPDWKNYRWWVGAPSGPLAAKVLALDPSGNPTGLPSECLLLDDGMCEIGAISGVRTSADVPSLKSVLYWDANADSVSYNVYMRPEGGGPLAFVQNVRNSPFPVRMAPDRVKFNDFLVRGVCKPGAQPSPDMANATAVQTGPGALGVLVVLALLTAAVALRFAAAKAR